MKYNEKTIERTMKAIDSTTAGSFWHIHRRSQCDEIQFCDISFVNLDGMHMSITFAGGECNGLVYVDETRNTYKYIANIKMDGTNADNFFMWLALTLYKMDQVASEILNERGGCITPSDNKRE